MTEILIFTAPKPFTDPHINTIQRNAIQSWKALGENVQVLLIGDEDGMQEVAADLNVDHYLDVEKNELGTPLVSSIFNIARTFSEAGILVYVNADIILLPDLLHILDGIINIKDDFLLVGQRWNLDQEQPLDYSGPWREELEKRISTEGKLSTVTAMDYFIFSRDLFQEVPAFAIGRAGWDNWMIYHALQQDWTVVDLTPTYQIIHQNHDYRHLPDGKIHYDQEESNQNVKLGGGFQNAYDLLDVRLVYRESKIRKKTLDLARLLRILERVIIPSQQKGLRWQITRGLRKTRKQIEKNRQ